eukprot:scaffold19724_cov23-Cyclotella_meneghiniana.AAC.1
MLALPCISAWLSPIVAFRQQCRRGIDTLRCPFCCRVAIRMAPVEVIGIYWPKLADSAVITMAKPLSNLIS